MATGAKRGHERERQVRRHLEKEGWWTCRAAGSLGDADVVALKRFKRARLIEVKSTSKTYERFQPADRKRLSEAAHVAGAEAELAWWPSRGELRFIPESEWPP